MIEILIIVLLSNIEMSILFIFMFYFMNKIYKDETISNPVTEIKQVVERKKANKEYNDKTKKEEIMLANINNYDGTSKGQQDI